MQERTGEVDASGALAAAAGAGPHFALETWAAAAGWRPASLLAHDQAVQSERVAHARRILADRAGIAPEDLAERVAASIVFLGLAARLVSPSLGAAVMAGVVPSMTLDSLWWRPVEGGPVPLAARRVTGQETGRQDAAGLDEAAVLLAEHCVQGLVSPVARAFQARFRLSPLVLRGNIASALAGAAGMLADRFPERAQAAAELTARILALEPLAGAGRLVQPDAARARRFLIRNSCCLFYRVPGGGTCGDCILTPEPLRRQQWRSAHRR